MPEKRVWLVHQFRQAYELDGTDLGQFGPSAEDRALRRQVQALDRTTLGEATRLFAISGNVAGRLERSTGLVAEVLPPPPQALPYRTAASLGFVLSASRLDRAKRIDLLLEAAALRSGFDVVIVSDGPDRSRLEGIARDRGLDGRVRFEGRVDAERLAELYATCSALYYAPVDEDYGMGPYEAFLSSKPVITTSDAGGPLDVVHDRRTGLVVAPAPAEIGDAAAWLAAHEEEAAVLGKAGQIARRRGDLGSRDREAALVKVAYFSPMPPETSGIADYSELLVPALREHVDVDVVKRGTKRPPRDADLAVYHIGNNPDAHDWILDALRRTPGLVVLHDFVLHHLVAGVTIGRRDGHGYLDAMEREHGVVGRLLAHGVLDKRIPPLWEARPEDFPLAGEVLSLATGLVVHSRYVEERARAAGFARPIARVPHPAWPAPDVPAADVDGAPLVGAFGNVNASKRVPQLLEAFARLRAEHPAARLLLVGATSPGFDLERRLQRLGLDGDGIVREGRVDERRLWALMKACDVHVSLRSPTMGETSGTAIRALTLGKPLVVSDVGWFAELPDDVALKVPVGRRRSAGPRGCPAAAGRAPRRA